MRTAVRSVLTHRSDLFGTVVTLGLAAVLLSFTAAWLEAGLRSPDLLLVAATSSFAGTLLLIVVFVVAGVLSAALRLRRREFALLRAVGATERQVRSMVRNDVLVVVGSTAPLGGVLGTVVAPRLTPLLESVGAVPAGWHLAPSPLPVLVTSLVLVPTGLVVARLAGREVTRVSPTAAIRDSVADVTPISRGRLWTAASLAVVGVLSAGAPALGGGTLGSATAASSGILLVVAAALAGPVLVRWLAERAVGVPGSSRAAGTLALLNARGFSRRLSAAVVPLALLVGLGVVQSGVNTGMVRAAEQQIEDGVRADLVATASGPALPDVAAVPGIATVSSSGSVTGAVRVDLADDDFGGALSWEPATLRTLEGSALDLGASSGSLADLTRPGTIAVGQDALLLTGTGVGDEIEVRLDGRVERRTVVAIYDRGLGFGDYTVGAGSIPAVDGSTLFVELTANADRAAVTSALTDLGLTVTDRSDFVAQATDAAGSNARFSLVLLLALLGLVAAAAANTLLQTTSNRRGEFALLHRTGATRGQVLRMLTVETAFTIVAAVGIGLVAVLPALTGVGYGLSGVPLPSIDVPTTLGVIAAVVVIAAGTVLPAGFRATAHR